LNKKSSANHISKSFIHSDPYYLPLLKYFIKLKIKNKVEKPFFLKLKDFFKSLNSTFLFCIFFFLCLTQTTVAQKIEWSNTISEDAKFDYIKVLGTDGNGFFVLKSNLPFDFKGDHYGFRKRRFAMAYFNNDMNLKVQKELSPVQRDMHISKVVFAHEKILIISYQQDKEKKQYTVFSQWLNNKGVSEQAPVKIETYNYLNKSDLEEMEVIVSKNQNKICLLTPTHSDENIEIQRVSATVIDTLLAINWQRQIEIPYSKKTYENQSGVLSDDGNLYILGHSIVYSKDKNIVPPNYIIFSYNCKKNSLNTIPITLNEYISDAGITIDNLHKKALISGFYGDKTTPVLAGIFSTSIDLETDIIAPIKTQPFEATIIDGAINLNQAQNNGNSNYSINRLVVRSDGGFVIVSEANYITQNSYYDYFTRSFINRTIYHYENILVISINPDGTIDWQQTIPKNQETQDDAGYYSSFCSLIYGNKINIIYNNTIDRSNTIYANSVTNKGKKEQKVLISEADRVIMVPQSALQIENNMLIVPGYRDRKFVYAKITY
jgi:hypothetical protein